MGAIDHVLDPIEMHNVLLKMFHHLGHGQFCSEYRSVGLAAGHDDLESFTGVFVLVWFVTYSPLYFFELILFVSLLWRYIDLVQGRHSRALVALVEKSNGVRLVVAHLGF